MGEVDTVCAHGCPEVLALQMRVVLLKMSRRFSYNQENILLKRGHGRPHVPRMGCCEPPPAPHFSLPFRFWKRECPSPRSWLGQKLGCLLCTGCPNGGSLFYA